MTSAEQTHDKDYLVKCECPQHLSWSQVKVFLRTSGLLQTGGLRLSLARFSDHDDGEEAEDGVDYSEHEKHVGDPLQHLRVGVISVTAGGVSVTALVSHCRDIVRVNKGGLQRDPD